MSAPIHDPDSTGQTPLHYAVCYPDPAAAAGLTQALLSAGCDPDTRRRTDGFAPLHLAAMMGRVEVSEEEDLTNMILMFPPPTHSPFFSSLAS